MDGYDLALWNNEGLWECGPRGHWLARSRVGRIGYPRPISRATGRRLYDSFAHTNLSWRASTRIQATPPTRDPIPRQARRLQATLNPTRYEPSIPLAIAPAPRRLPSAPPEPPGAAPTPPPRTAQAHHHRSRAPPARRAVSNPLRARGVRTLNTLPAPRSERGTTVRTSAL